MKTYRFWRSLHYIFMPVVGDVKTPYVNELLEYDQ